MVDLKERVVAEEESIQGVLSQLPSVERLPFLSALELAGVGALLHNFYNGLENVLKQVLLTTGERVPDGPSWHRDLLDATERRQIIGSGTAQGIAPFMAFRHFFSHGYALDLDPERMEMLVRDAAKVFAMLHEDVVRFMGD